MIRNYHCETALNKTFMLHAAQVAAWKKYNSFLFIKDLSVRAVSDNTVSANWHFKRHFEEGRTVKKMTIFHVQMCFLKSCLTGFFPS